MIIKIYFNTKCGGKPWCAGRSSGFLPRVGCPPFSNHAPEHWNRGEGSLMETDVRWVAGRE